MERSHALPEGLVWRDLVQANSETCLCCCLLWLQACLAWVGHMIMSVHDADHQAQSRGAPVSAAERTVLKLRHSRAYACALAKS